MASVRVFGCRIVAHATHALDQLLPSRLSARSRLSGRRRPSARDDGVAASLV